MIKPAAKFRIVERDMIESFVKRGFQIDMIQKWILERFANGIKNIINGPFTFGPDGNPMIGPGPGTRVMVATRPVDFRKGPDALAALGKRLRTACGSGGTAKDGVLEIQGDHVERVMALLAADGHKVKRAGG